MKIALSVCCFLLFFYPSGFGIPRALASAFDDAADHAFFEDTGIILSAADFWIGIPEQRNSMPYLKISQGTRVRILAQEKGFFRIEHRNIMGYVEKKFVKVLPSESSSPIAEQHVAVPSANSPAADAATASSTGYLLTQATSLRTQPDSKAGVLLRFAPGDEVEVLESTGKYWWKVRFQGQTGWAKSALLKKQ